MNGTKSSRQRLAVCLATYQRRAELRRLLGSLARMQCPEGVCLELRVVDNDRTGSAHSEVAEFRKLTHPFLAVHYSVEPRQNIAHARNATVEMGRADAMVFVDDDEWVEPTWLVNLWATYVRSGADVVLGPVRGQCGADAPAWMQRGRFFDKVVPVTGSRVDWRKTRTSNTLVSGEWFNGPEGYRFDPALGRSGGSDSDLFSRLEAKGARFVTCREATVSEDVPPERARFVWLWKRFYRNGLIYERIVVRNGRGRHPAVRLARRFLATAWLGGRGIPALLLGRPEGVVAGLMRLALGLGGLVAWLRPAATTHHVAYGSDDPQAVEPEPTRVAFLTNMVSPYRKPVFSRLAETPGWDFRVFADAEKEFDRKWKVDCGDLVVKRTRGLSFRRTITSKEPVPFKQVITLHLPFGLLWDLFRFRPQAVISLELGCRTALAALYCTVFRRPLVIWAYQSRISGTQGGWRNPWRRWLLRRARHVVGMGTQAREVLRGWGVPEEAIVDAPNAADHVSLGAALRGPEARERIAAIRARHAAERRLAIVVGRMVPLKGIESLLPAWRAVPASIREQWKLVFVGDGPLESLIREEMDPSIESVGYVPSEEIAYWYAAADLHIFPTCGDVWGLVVNEASACGAPTLCSIHAGCYEDLIRHGVTGLGIDFTRPDVARSLARALARPDLDALGVAAAQHATAFTLDRMAESFRGSVVSALNGSTGTRSVRITGLISRATSLTLV